MPLRAKPGTPNPGHFTVPMYRELQKKLGLERVIVVQPNAYGDDNAVTLNAMKQIGKNAKGVGCGQARRGRPGARSAHQGGHLAPFAS